jgi:hypothetical protein
VEWVDRAAAAVRGGTLPSFERLTPPFSPDLLRAFAADLMLNRPDLRIGREKRGRAKETQMLKVMFVLAVLSQHISTAPVVISQHSTFEACERAFQSFQAQIARNTSSSGFSSTTVRTHACSETEVWVSGKE